MKKLLVNSSMLLVLIIALNCTNFSQTKTSNIVSKNDTITFLIRQNENAQDLIEKQKNRIADLETELAAEKENSNSLSKSYESAKSEITSLKSSNEALARAAALNEQTITLLQADNAKQRDKAKKATKQKFIVLAAAAGAIALKLLLP